MAQNFDVIRDYCMTNDIQEPDDMIRDKKESMFYYMLNTLNRTVTMFEYENLPDTIPEKEMEKIIQQNGYCAFIEVDGDYYVTRCSLAPGKGLKALDPYGRGKVALVTNPYLVNKDYVIDEECVIISNDPFRIGLLPIINRNGYLLTEADITLLNASILYRASYGIVANDDTGKASAEMFMEAIEAGNMAVMHNEALGGILEDGSDGIKALPLAGGSNGAITQLIELKQYLKAGLYNELGLDANYNMKRERLSEGETDLNQDVLRPLIDAMLEERQNAIKKINEMFGLNISVKFGSAWSQYNESEVEEDEEIGEDEEIDNQEVVDENEEVDEINGSGSEDVDRDGEEDGGYNQGEMVDTGSVVEVVEAIGEIVETIAEMVDDDVVEDETLDDVDQETIEVNDGEEENEEDEENKD